MPAGALTRAGGRTFGGSLIVGTGAALTTAVQVLWASPAAPSAADSSASPLPYLAWLCLFALLMTVALLVLPRSIGAARRGGIVIGALAVYWSLLDYHEFMVRVAAWSTFDAASLWLHVLKASALPIVICAAALALLSGMVVRHEPASRH